jgi:N-acetylmuramoyl-L-alanine amidase
MKSWICFCIVVWLGSLSQPAKVVHSWLGAGNAAAGISVCCGENLLEALDQYYESSEETMETETAETEEETEPETEAAVLPQNRWNIRLSEEEMDLLARIVWVEARGESDEGQKAVAEVVFNRMRHSAFPDTLYEVVSQSTGGYLQFTSWKYVDTAAPTEKEYRNIREVLDGQTALTNDGTIYFSTSPQTGNITCVIGAHYFCE